MKSGAIDVTTFSEARANLKSVMDRVVEDHVPVIIRRRKAEPVVMISLSDWNAWQETAYLNSTAANRRALDESIARADAGDLIEVEFGADRNLHPVKPTDAS
jgi:antitoxin YefM